MVLPMVSRVLLFAALLAGAVAAAGCGPDPSCWPASTDTTCGSPSGGATIVVPTGFEAVSQIILEGDNCLSLPDGSCMSAPYFIIKGLFGAIPEERFEARVFLPPGEGAATYGVSPANASPAMQAEPSVSGTVKLGQAGGPGGWVVLAPVSGTIAVQQSSAERFVATFQIAFETRDQQAFSLENGSFALDGCQIVRVEAGCVAGN